MGTRSVTLGIALLTALGTASAQAAEIRVPEDVKSHRRALRKAKPGDVVILAAGRYRGKLVVRKPGVTVRGEGAVFRARKKGAPAVVIRGAESAVEGVTVERGSVVVKAKAEFAAVRGLHLRDVQPRTVIDVLAVGVHVEDNHLEPVTFAETGQAAILIRADDAVVSGNRSDAVLYAEAEFGPRGQNDFIRVEGDDAVVVGNELDIADGSTGVRVIGDRAVVTGNEVAWGPDGVVVEGDNATVTGNSVTNGFGIAIDVVGDDAVLTANVTQGRSGEGLRVTGDRYRVAQNELSMGGFTRPPPAEFQVIENDGSAPDTAAQFITVAIDWEPSLSCPGIVIRSGTPGGVVEDNVIEYTMGTALEAHVDGAVIRDNQVFSNGGDSGLVVRGADNVVEGNDLALTGAVYADAIQVVGNHNAVRDNDLSANESTSNGIKVDGMWNEVGENRLAGFGAHAIDTSGGRNTIQDNRILDPRHAERSSHVAILIAEDGRNVVVRNVIEDTAAVEGEFAAASGIDVTGDMNVVEENRVAGLVLGSHRVSLTVDGARNTVRNNEVTSAGGVGLSMRGDANNIAGNCVTSVGPVPVPAPAAAETSADCPVKHSWDIRIVGLGNVVRENESDGAWGTGIIVSGTENYVVDNEACNSNVNGFIVAGERNGFLRNLSENARETGIFVAYGTDNVVIECTATGSGACGLESEADMTSLVRDTFTGSGVHDIQILGTVDAFEGNVFETIFQP